jgi:hypothetical protein
LRSELAAVSFNLLMLLAALSSPVNPSAPLPDELDASDPYRTDGCSFSRPGMCRSVGFTLFHLTAELDDDPSGLPQVRWIWETGADFQIEGATEGLACFENWSLHSVGPEFPAVAGSPFGVRFLLGPPADDEFCVAHSSLVQAGSAGPDGMPGTGDDGTLAAVYGVPEPGAGMLRFAALAALAVLVRRGRTHRTR